MAKSLQEQLLNAGLVDKKKTKAIKQQKRKQSKLIKQGIEQADDSAERIRKAREQDAERDRQLNKEREQKAELKALQAQVKQLIEHHRLTRPQDGVDYQFVVDKKIKKINVSPEQQNQLANGLIGIAEKDGYYELVPAKTARKIQERWPETIVMLNDSQAGSGPMQKKDDDPYADYEIPDDLMW